MRFFECENGISSTQGWSVCLSNYSTLTGAAEDILRPASEDSEELIEPVAETRYRPCAYQQTAIHST